MNKFEVQVRGTYGGLCGNTWRNAVKETDSGEDVQFYSYAEAEEYANEYVIDHENEDDSGSRAAYTVRIQQVA